MFGQHRSPSVSTPHQLGEVTAIADIAKHGVEYAETFVLVGIDFMTDSFIDGYMIAVQRHYRSANVENT